VGPILRLLHSLPAVLRWGAAITLLGLGIDIVVHTIPGAASGPAAAIGHLVTLLGMAVCLVAVTGMGVRGSIRATSGRRS
jgi:hypothetical protein